MERLDNACLSRVMLFLGQPDRSESEQLIRSRGRQISFLAWVSQRLTQWWRFWYDNEMDIDFHA